MSFLHRADRVGQRVDKTLSLRVYSRAVYRPTYPVVVASVTLF